MRSSVRMCEVKWKRGLNMKSTRVALCHRCRRKARQDDMVERVTVLSVLPPELRQCDECGEVD
jgi:hypothetical protein